MTTARLDLSREVSTERHLKVWKSSPVIASQFANEWQWSCMAALWSASTARVLLVERLGPLIGYEEAESLMAELLDPVLHSDPKCAAAEMEHAWCVDQAWPA